jgi:hypothetical protein
VHKRLGGATSHRHVPVDDIEVVAAAQARDDVEPDREVAHIRTGSSRKVSKRVTRGRSSSHAALPLAQERHVLGKKCEGPRGETRLSSWTRS